MLNFNVTMEVKKGEYSYTEEYDLTCYSEEEILEYMQNGINLHIEEDGGEEITIGMEDLKIVDIDFPTCLYTDDMTLSELIDTAIYYEYCSDEDEISIVMEYRDEIGIGDSASSILDRYIGQYDDMEEFARQDFQEFNEIPEHLEPYIDWEKVAEDYKYDFSITSNGYIFRTY